MIGSATKPLHEQQSDLLFGVRRWLERTVYCSSGGATIGLVGRRSDPSADLQGTCHTAQAKRYEPDYVRARPQAEKKADSMLPTPKRKID
mmetsp:Transcript_3569/g.4869  ORF Transcript_3569/g.4869 Transcript_3569/m.4869 type:complete len:90 (+) Transcript_3569:151-420(+)